MPAILLIILLGLVIFCLPADIDRTRAIEKLNHPNPILLRREYEQLNEQEQAVFWKSGGKIE